MKMISLKTPGIVAALILALAITLNSGCAKTKKQNIENHKSSYKTAQKTAQQRLDELCEEHEFKSDENLKAAEPSEIENPLSYNKDMEQFIQNLTEFADTQEGKARKIFEFIPKNRKGYKFNPKTAEQLFKEYSENKSFTGDNYSLSCFYVAGLRAIGIAANVFEYFTDDKEKGIGCIFKTKDGKSILVDFSRFNEDSYGIFGANNDKIKVWDDKKATAVYLNNLAIQLLEQGRYEKAQGLLEKAVQISSDSPEVHFNLGKFYYELGFYGKALKELKYGLELSPEARERVEPLLKQIETKTGMH